MITGHKLAIRNFAHINLICCGTRENVLSLLPRGGDGFK